MADEKQKNGRITWPTLAAVATALLALGGSWFTWGQQAGELRQRVMNVEQRQSEDRKETKDNISEVKRDVKQIGSDVQTILQTIKAMEAVQRAERSKR